jgi:hypothetical protein
VQYPPPSSMPPQQPTPPSFGVPHPMQPPQRTPTAQARGRRLTASTLILVAAILLTVSLFVSWWTANVSGGGTNETLYFLPGYSYSATGNAGMGVFSGSQTYAAAGFTHLGQLYEVVLWVGIVSLIAAFIAAILGYIGAFGVFRSRAGHRATLVLTVVSFVTAVLLPPLVTLGQPGAFAADSNGGCGAGTSPCNSFWGSMTTDGVTSSWGADVGWYLALAAAVLVVVALVLFLSSRREPYTSGEIWAASAQPVAPSAYPAPWGLAAPNPQDLPAAQAPTYPQYTSWVPPPRLYATAPTPPAAPAPVAAAPATPACPRCGNPSAFIPQYSRYYCWSCRAYL